MSLTPEVRQRYVEIIDSILAGADLMTISVKQVRTGIQSQVQYDITPHKAAINEMVHERFNVAEANQQGAERPVPSVETAEPEPAPQTNGVHKSPRPSAATPSQASTGAKRGVTSEDLSDVVDDAPPKKKRKASAEDDAALAARLQAEEDKMARPTRGGASRKAAPTKKKKTPKKKSRAKVDGSDASEVDGEDKPKRNTGFHKPLNLSPQLSSLLDGEIQLSRPEVTKRLWKYIKGNGLQDEKDKRFIICDERMRTVFKQDKVHMFTMTKLVNEHMYNPDE